jgi:hypothetical protein
VKTQSQPPNNLTHCGAPQNLSQPALSPLQRVTGPIASKPRLIKRYVCLLVLDSRLRINILKRFTLESFCIFCIGTLIFPWLVQLGLWEKYSMHAYVGHVVVICPMKAVANAKLLWTVIGLCQQSGLRSNTFIFHLCSRLLLSLPLSLSETFIWRRRAK